MKPKIEQLLIAIDWLNLNGGEGEEKESCQAVAKWLQNEVGKKKDEILAEHYDVQLRIWKKIKKSLTKRKTGV